MKKLPREALAELRERAKRTTMDCAKALGLKSSSGYHRYEREATQGDRPIPAKIISALVPLFVGRGKPPITHDEMIAISDFEDTMTETRNVSGTSARVVAFPPVIGVQVVPGPLTSSPGQGTPFLIVRYRVERGAWIEEAGMAKRNYGVATIGPVAEVDMSAQFACLVIDGWRTEYLHCVEPEHVAPRAAIGKRCIVSVQRPTDKSLVELMVCRITAIADGKLEYYDTDGRRIDGTLLGIVIGKYERE